MDRGPQILNGLIVCRLHACRVCLCLSAGPNVPTGYVYLAQQHYGEMNLGAAPQLPRRWKS